MKNYLFTITALLIATAMFAQNPVTGKWKTIDDQTGKALAIIDIFEKGGKINGRVIDILDGKSRNHTCENCPGDDKNKPIIGLVVMKGLSKDGDEYN